MAGQSRASRRRASRAHARTAPTAPSAPAPAAAAVPRFRPWLAMLLIVVAGALVYLNSFSGAFIFDDMRTIVDNDDIRTFSRIMNRRPVVNVLMALNYRFGGLDPTGYHAVNLTVHLLAALALFGLVRRTFALEPLATTFARSGPWIALAAALLWVVHPLNTQSVTYLTQRGEALMGLFYILSLYCLNRQATASGRAAAAGWTVALVLALGLGMGSKAIMVTAPLALVLYDWVFLSRSLKSLIRRRWWLYGGLAVVGVVGLLATGVAQSVLSTERQGAATVGFSVSGVTPLQYAATQLGVVMHYARLVIWPDPLVLDYWWPMARTSDAVVFPAMVIGVMLLVTAWLLWRRPRLGYVAFMFFLILAPTSTIVPVQDAAVEHRMYLSLAAAIVFLIVVVARLGARLLAARGQRGLFWGGFAVVALVAILLGMRTVARNRDYTSEDRMWHTVLAERPHNPRAHAGVANGYAERGDTRTAIAHYAEALAIAPNLWKPRGNLGQILLETGNVDQAIILFEQAVELRPNFFEAQVNLGEALVVKGDLERAIPALRRAVKLDGRSPVGHNNLGRALYANKQYRSAEKSFRRALELEPGDDEAVIWQNLGNALMAQDRTDEAIAAYERSLSLAPSASVHGNIGALHAQAGRPEQAIRQFIAALRLDPDYARARQNFAAFLSQQPDIDGTVATIEGRDSLPWFATVHGHAWKLRGDDLWRGEQHEQAVLAYRRALQIDRTHAEARSHLELLENALKDAE